MVIKKPAKLISIRRLSCNFEIITNQITMSNLQLVWRPVVGYEKFYKVSCIGDVYSLRQNKLLKPHPDRKGYLKVKLYGAQSEKLSTRVHRLVAYAFLPNPQSLPEVNHIDYNKLNNHYSNLEWCTTKHNVNHSFKTFSKEFIKGRTKNRVLPSRLGAKNSFAKKVINEGTGEIFGCVGDAASRYGYTYNQLKSWLNGSRKNKSALKYL